MNKLRKIVSRIDEDNLNTVTLAIEKLKEMIKDPGSDIDLADVYKELGRAHFVNGEFSKSYSAYKKALEMKPDNGSFHYELGVLYSYGFNRNSEAMEEFNHALDLGYENSDVHKDIARVYHKQGKHRLAAEELEHVKRDKNTCIEIGRAKRKRGDFEGAERELRNALKHSANDILFENKISNEIEITRKKTHLDSKPQRIWVTLTNRCNLKCRMCEFWKMPWDIPRKTIDEIIEYMPYLEEMLLQGGEVFLSEYFEELIDKSSQHPGLKVAITTNGLLIDERWAEKLARDVGSVTISIDGITKEDYEYTRVGGRFEDLLESLKHINKVKNKYKKTGWQKMVTVMQVVVMKSNYKKLADFIDFASEFKFDTVSLNPIGKVTGPENIFADNNSDIVRYVNTEVIPKVSQKAKENGITLDNWLPDHRESEGPDDHENTKEKRKSKERKRNTSTDVICALPWQQMLIDPKGALRPHCVCKKELGNIHESSLESLWNNRQMKLFRKKLLEGKNLQGYCDLRCVSEKIHEDYLGFRWSE